jgi:dihydroorotase
MLEGFASFHGPAFYGMPRNRGTVTLERKSWTLPESVPFGDAAVLVPMEAGVEQHWKLMA